MGRMTAAPLSMRSALAAVLFALLALRLLAPAGFMPAFDRGGVTIVACPDSLAMAPMRHSPRDPGKFHQLCPYAAAATVAALGLGLALAFGVIVFLAAPRIARPHRLVAQAKAREPPRLRGPPFPA